ncbi:substrate-binding region of ABC-type glycine betaine transport system [Paenibacillus curdlanolyticus YK9]|uniref:Substrate-binding region of ABC-type glycine betaine transport system n=1 Tax=Paenibacillus curdlanolyticus YK9 TaxID=717606 RepID=E0I8R5_9BACL|nr:substrate-binding region of ABC-type glycine betaine transport system [Paenibacillus curdlanolyticus YK9]
MYRLRINKTCAFVIEAKYEDVDNFNKGLAPAKFGNGEDARWGFINRKGKIIIKPQFRFAMPFEGGLAQVTIGEPTLDQVYNLPFGYINRQGEYVWKPSH